MGQRIIFTDPAGGADVLAAQRVEKLFEDNGYLVDYDEDLTMIVIERPVSRAEWRRR